jgi:orotate phosphoribosyltransferase-like protein
MKRINVDTRLQNRTEAGVLLSRKLAAYKNSDAVVVGIPHGGVCVASAIADILSLSLEVMPCRKIKNSARTLGGKTHGRISATPMCGRLSVPT